MKKVLVLYYSRSGNTEKMAKAVAEGAQISGVQVELNYHIEPKQLSAYDAVVVGAPTYRKEMPLDFKNLFEEALEEGIRLKGKIGAVFGSYGWNAEAPKRVLDLMKKLEMQILDEPIIAKYIPDQATIEACRKMGKRISESLMNQA